MSSFKTLSKIKNSVLITLISTETGEQVEHVILRPSGRVTGTKAQSLDLASFTKKEKKFYIEYKNQLLYTAGQIYSKSKLLDTLKAFKEYTKHNKLKVLVLSEVVNE